MIKKPWGEPNSIYWFKIIKNSKLHHVHLGKTGFPVPGSMICTPYSILGFNSNRCRIDKNCKIKD